MGYQEPQTIHIMVDEKNKPILQVAKEDLPIYLKEKQKRDEEKNQKTTS